MLRSSRRHVPGWIGLVSAVGSLVTVSALSGCPGTLDPTLLNGTGGAATGGTTGAGGGTGGTGGSNCTGALDGATLITGNCAISGCHTTADAPTFAAGLDLTINATIGSRLVGVVSPGDTTASAAQACAGKTYLAPMSNPPTGLLIDKITLPNGSAGLCGDAMPYPGISRLTAAQQTCVEQWAEGLIMAAGAQ